MTRPVVTFPLLSCLLLAAPALATAQDSSAAKVVWTASEGFDAPESAYFDSDTQTIFVSQIGGSGGEKDGKGWISKLNLKGEVLDLHWVDGLNAPKGIRSHKGTLWVSDIDTLVGIDIASGEIKHRLEVPDAVFLNDVAAAADGTIYVSDMRGGKIVQYKDGILSTFVEGIDKLETCNGLLVDGDRLIVGGWERTKDDGSKVAGRLFSLDRKTGKKTVITKPLGNIDGIELDGRGGFVLTDWVAGKVYHVAKDGSSKDLLAFEQSTADHAYLPDRKLLILPHMKQNKVVAYDLSPLVD